MPEAADDKREGVAVVVGATGLVGREVVRFILRSLKQQGNGSSSFPSASASASASAWAAVYGVARSRPDDDRDDAADPSYRFLECDLLDREDVLGKLLPLAEHVTHLFWVTWSSKSPLGTADCRDHNRAMLSNTLDALLPITGSALCHVSLQTGAGGYVSLLAPSPDDDNAVCYFEEESPRVDGVAHEFYYVLEDLLRERLSRRIGWSVHRPGLVLGASGRSFYNIMGCLGVYASVCKHLGLPFIFGGNRKCWEVPYIDVSDARLVADQLIWRAGSSYSSSPSSSLRYGEAFNAVNETLFTWKEVWPALASKFDLLPNNTSADDIDALFSETFTFAGLMADKGAVWDAIVERQGLRRTRMEDLANWGFLDGMLRCQGRMLVSREKARRLGFSTTNGQDPTASFLYWVDRMREERLIP